MAPSCIGSARVGKEGVEFELLKLRTMVVGAEKLGAGYAVNEGDPRITRAGRVLRRLSLDELPQLWNVLRGDMSLDRPAAHARVPGRALHASPAAAAGGQAGDHRLGPGARARHAAVGRADRARRLVRRAPLAVARPEDPGPDAAGALRRDVQGRDRRLEGESSLTARFEATDEESLERLTGYVHDAWFDLDQITQEDDVVSIPIALRGVRVKKRFLPEHTKPPGSYESSLVIRAVTDFEIEEPEQIGVYGINYFTYDPPRLTIVAEANCTVTLEVDELNVEAELRMPQYEWALTRSHRARRSYPQRPIR